MADGTIRAGDFQRMIDAEYGALSRAATVGTRAATEGLKTELRQAIQAAGLGKVANVIGSRVYPARGDSLTAAGQVFVRGGGGRGVGEKILEAFSQAMVIGPRNGQALAIPTRNVPRKPGRGGGRMSPGEVAARCNAELRAGTRPGRPSLVVLDGGRGATARNRRGSLGAGAGAMRSRKTIVMFILVRGVKTTQRFNPQALYRKWLAQIPDLIDRALPKSK